MNLARKVLEQMGVSDSEVESVIKALGKACWTGVV